MTSSVAKETDQNAGKKKKKRKKKKQSSKGVDLILIHLQQGLYSRIDGFALDRRIHFDLLKYGQWA